MPMNLYQLHNLDLTSVPDDALFAMREAVRAELQRRGKYRHSRDQKVLSIIKNRHHSPRSPDRQKYLPALLADDWSKLYPLDKLCQERKYYVYAHLDSAAGRIDIGDLSFNGLPFYIGKGTGRRAYDLKRNEGHGAELRLMREFGRSPYEIVQILKDGLTEQEAYCLEAKLIHFFGTRFDGVKNGILVNLTKPPTPYQ